MIHCGSSNIIKIHHVDSATNNILQVIDFVVYAAGRKYNASDLKWYNYLKKFVLKEEILKLHDKNDIETLLSRGDSFRKCGIIASVNKELPDVNYMLQ